MDKNVLLKLLKGHGFKEPILKAFEKVKREKFIPEKFKSEAYENYAIPLEEESTISQPSTIAYMLNLLELKRGQKVLEIGSGCGYVLALIKEIIEEGIIYGMEISHNLVKQSREYFKGYKEIFIINKDGYYGIDKIFRPLDRILVSAAYDKIPVHLYEQLNNQGILVAPVNNGKKDFNGRNLQSIFKIKKENDKIIKEELKDNFIFVELRKNLYSRLN